MGVTGQPSSSKVAVMASTKRFPRHSHLPHENDGEREAADAHDWEADAKDLAATANHLNEELHEVKAQVRRVIQEARANDSAHRARYAELEQNQTRGERQLGNADQRIAHLEGLLVAANNHAAAQLDIIKSLSQQLARSPEILTEAMLSGIAAIYNPPLNPQPAAEQANVKETNIGAQDTDLPGRFFPDVEFDESMEGPELWPTPGTMADPTRTPIPPSPTRSGYPTTRPPEAPPFLAGEGNPSPPAGGIE